MKNLITRNTVLALMVVAVLAPLGSSLVQADDNNYNRAIGLAHSAPGIADCLSAALADGHGVVPEARGSLDENGEFTNWTVVYYSDLLSPIGTRIILAVVYIESWEIVGSECRDRPF